MSWRHSLVVVAADYSLIDSALPGMPRHNWQATVGRRGMDGLGQIKPQLGLPCVFVRSMTFKASFGQNRADICVVADFGCRRMSMQKTAKRER